MNLKCCCIINFLKMKKITHFLFVNLTCQVWGVFIMFLGDISAGDKSKKGVKRRRITEDSGETAKRRSARVRNTKCKKEEKVDFQELLVKFLPSRYCTATTFIMR